MVSNPIGLYVGEVDVTGFRDPQGRRVERERILTVHRGSFSDQDGLSRVLRFSIHPPKGAEYGLESCSVDGHPLVTGGPIARQTTVVIHGVAMASDAEQSITECISKACPHPTRRPEYFVAVPPGEACPKPTDPDWDGVDVTLAPASTAMVAAGPGLRSGGARGA